MLPYLVLWSCKWVLSRAGYRAYAWKGGFMAFRPTGRSGATEAESRMKAVYPR